MAPPPPPKPFAPASVLPESPCLSARGPPLLLLLCVCWDGVRRPGYWWAEKRACVGRSTGWGVLRCLQQAATHMDGGGDGTVAVVADARWHWTLRAASATRRTAVQGGRL